MITKLNKNVLGVKGPILTEVKQKQWDFNKSDKKKIWIVLILFYWHDEIPGDGVAPGCGPPEGPELVMAGLYSVSGVELDGEQGN